MGRTTPRGRATRTVAAVVLAMAPANRVAEAAFGADGSGGGLAATAAHAAATGSDGLGGVVFTGRAYEVVLTFVVAGGERDARTAATAVGGRLTACRGTAVIAGTASTLRCRLAVPGPAGRRPTSARSRSSIVTVVLTITTASGSVVRGYDHLVL